MFTINFILLRFNYSLNQNKTNSIMIAYKKTDYTKHRLKENIFRISIIKQNHMEFGYIIINLI